MTRVVIESPYGTKADGTRCTPDEVARNLRYLDRCIRDSLGMGEAPYASHGFFTSAGRLDDNDPQQRKLGIAAGLAWGAAAGPGWYYWDDEYRDEGSVGAFVTRAEAEEHAREAGYRW